MPLAAGTYYYGVCVDDVTSESNTANNCSTGVALTVENLAPVATGTLPAQTLVIGTASVVDMAPYFSDPNEDTLTYTASSSSLGIVSVEMSGLSDSHLKMTPLAAGTATVTIEVTDLHGLSFAQSFSATVNPAPNRAPAAVGTISDQTLMARGASRILNVSSSFYDLDADTLHYTASSNNTGVVSVNISGSQVTLVPEGKGSATVTVTASDGELTATQTISVSITPYLGEETWMPDATLRAAVRTAIGLQPNDTLTQQAMKGLIILNAASSVAGTGVQNLIGLEHATQLTILNLGRTGVRDLTLLQTLTQLTQLNLIYTEISDLSPLQGLTNLTHLNLLQTRARNIMPLQRLINLTHLNLGRTGIRDLTPLQRLTALTSLDLSFNNIGNLTPLGSLTALTSLNLGHTTINDITSLQGLTALTSLDLKNNQISDIASLSGLTQLVQLYLDGNQISDVSPLEGLTSLQFLRLKYNPIADVAPLHRLKEKNPSVSIDVDIEIQTPDLRVESVSVDKNTVAPGETFRLSTTIKNQGEADASAVNIRYYQSTDDTISTTDTELTTATLGLIAIDSMSTPSTDLTAPDTPGTHYYGVCIDAVEGESNTTNNCSTSVAISVENRAPISVGTLPPRTLSENDAPIAVDVAQYFNDPDNTPLTYTAASDNTAVVLAQIKGGEVTITPVGAGNAIVTVTASDGDLTTTQTLTVSVVAAPTENEAPLPIDVIPAQSLTVDGASSTVDISAYFSDANGDTLTYAAWPDDKNVVRLLREGTLLTITPKAAGRATVTVRARDPDGLEVFQHFSVFVSTTEVPVTELPAETWMPDANLRAAVRTALGLGPNDALTQQALQTLTSLRYLGPDLSDNQKITDLTGLEYALNLEHLDLYMHLISDLRPLEKLAKLRSLWLAGNKISNIRPLTRLPLEGLDLGGNPITDFTPLAELTSLTRLDFWGNGLGDNNLHLITGLTQLTQLDLRNNQISNVTSLTKLVNLKKLRLEGNSISDTAPLLTLTSQNPDLEIDIEIDEEPPSKPDTEIEAEVPDLMVESIRVNKTAVDPGDTFRLDAVIKNQGKAASDAAMVRFYRSPDATITTEDTEVRRSDLPSLAVGRTKNKWVRLTAPKTVGVYYYGVCIDDVADEGNTENNCSTAVKITVGTVTVEPPVVETPATTDPEAEGSLAKQVFEKHSNILQRQDVKAVLPDVFPVLKEPDTQALLNPHTIELVIADPDLLKKMVPTISDKFITLMKTDAAIKTLLSDAQVQTLLQTPTAIDELAKLLGVSIAPPPTANEHWMPDANLRAAVRKALGLKPSETLTPQAMRKLTHLDVQLSQGAVSVNRDQIKYITGLEHATQLTELILSFHQISDLSPLKNLTALTKLSIWGCEVKDLIPLKNLTALTYLGLSYNQISDLTPLKNLTALRTLFLEFNQISDITPLKNLTALTGLTVGWNNKVTDVTALKNLTALWWLSFEANKVTDITALKNLTRLRDLDIGRNQIRDITPLTGLTNLTGLLLHQNQISDVTPLANLTNLTELKVRENPIADLAPLRRLKAKNPGVSIDIDINAGAAPSAPLVPAETALLPNYPNPFNPETWIPYQLAKSADVALTIYDVRGVVVRRLALGHRPAGFYQSRARAAHWNGRNALGEKVASGLYFYTFTAGSFTATQKMLIRK